MRFFWLRTAVFSRQRRPQASLQSGYLYGPDSQWRCCARFGPVCLAGVVEPEQINKITELVLPVRSS